MNYKILSIMTAMLAAGALGAQAQALSLYSADVNYTGEHKGFHTYDSATDIYTVNGSGADVWGTSDSFYFVYTLQELDSDFDYFVKINNFDGNANSWQKAGLMVRECGFETYNEEAQVNGYEQYGGSRYFSLASQRATNAEEKRWTCQWRGADGANVNDNSSWRTGAFSYPSWQRIRRMGNVYTSYVSLDGKNWTQIYSVDTGVPMTNANGEDVWAIPLGDSAMGLQLAVGMWVTSHNSDSTDAQALFEGFGPFPQEPVEITGAPGDLKVPAGASCTITAEVSGYDPISYTWKKGATVVDSGLTAGTSVSFTLPAVAMSDAGDYSLEVSNVTQGTTNQKTATFKLSVYKDEVAPTISSIQALGKTIGITFSEAVDQTSAEALANYTVAGKTVSSALLVDSKRVMLTLNSALNTGSQVDVSVKSIADLSGNVIANTTVPAEAAFAVSNSGNPFVAGSAEALGGESFRINNQGLYDWGTYDEDTLVYKTYQGDFDIRILLNEQDASTSDGRAGIKIRENLDERTTENHGRYAEVHLRPMQTLKWDADLGAYSAPADNMSGFTDFRNRLSHIARNAVGGNSYFYTDDVDSFLTSGEAKTEAKNLEGKVWMRLNRTGDTMSAYYSTDGAKWNRTGTVTMDDLAETLYAGPHYAIEGRNFATDAENLPENLINEFKNPTKKFYASFSDWSEGYLEAVSFVKEPVASIHLQAPQALTITVEAAGDPLTYQWYKDGVALVGADAATLSLPYTAASDAGSYTCEVMNFGHGAADKGTSAMSQATVVTIDSDTEAPLLIDYGFSLTESAPYFEFNKGMDVASLSTLSNYLIKDTDGNFFVPTAVNINDNATYVTLVVELTSESDEFTVELSNLKDRSGNLLVVEGPLTFMARKSYPIQLAYYEGADAITTITPFVEAVRAGKTPTRYVPDAGGMTIPVNQGDNYAIFFSGMIQAPESGYYRFAVSSDDDCWFYLSSDSSYENLSVSPIARVNNSVGSGDFDAQSNQQSSDIRLEAGQLYYFEVYFVERTGGDFLQIAWSLPSQGPSAIPDNSSPISSEYVKWIVVPSHTTLAIASQPEENLSVAENANFSLEVGVDYASDMGPRNQPSYTWYVKNDMTGGEWALVSEALVGMRVTGASSPKLTFTGMMSTSAGVYRMDAKLLDQTVSTSEITLNVTHDSDAPTAEVAGSASMQEVMVSFSEGVFGADVAENYSIAGLTVLGVVYPEDSELVTRVTLNTTAQEEGKEYTVVFNNIADMNGNPVENKPTFTSFVWAQGFALFEAFESTCTYETIGDVIDWNFNNHTYRANPQVGTVTEIVAGTFNQDNYVARISGFIMPSESGTYEFAGSSDDSFKAFLSTDESPANLDRSNPVAWQNAWTSARIYDYTPAANTGAVTEMGGRQVDLTAGQRYYYNVILQEGTGGDYVALTWRKLPNAMQANGTEPIIKDELLGIYVDPEKANITIEEQPVNLSAPEYSDAVFSVIATTVNEFNAPIQYQWYMDGVAVSDAKTSQLAVHATQDNNGKSVYCELKVPGRDVVTETVKLTVVANESAPVVEAVSGMGGKIYVAFDSRLNETSATDIAHYTVEGAAISSAVIEDPASAKQIVILTLTNPEYAGTRVTVSVKDVENLAGIAIEPVTLSGDYLELNGYNINATGEQGGYTYDASAGAYTIQGSGADLWGASDSFYYFCEPIGNGDFEYTAKLQDFWGTSDGWMKCGLMVREGDAEGNQKSDARYFGITTQRSSNPSNNTFRTQWRRAVGENVGDGQRAEVGTLYYPHYQRLSRVGNILTSYYSEDGVKWMKIAEQDCGAWSEGPLGATLPLYIGMWATSHSNTSNDSFAKFSEVKLVGDKPLPPEPPVDDLELAYTLEEGVLILRWAANPAANLEVSPTADGPDWTLIKGELEDGVMKARIPLDTANTAGFYRLVSE